MIVNRDALARLPLRIIVPLTAWRQEFEGAPWHVRVGKTEENGLSKESSADTFQVRSIPEERLVEKLEEITAPVMNAIDKGLALSLGLDH